MARGNFGNALNTIGSFQSNLQGYFLYIAAALVLVFGLFFIAKDLWAPKPKAWNEDDKPAVRSLAWRVAFIAIIVGLLVLLGRLQFLIAKSANPLAKTARQAGALSLFLPSPSFSYD